MISYFFFRAFSALFSIIPLQALYPFSNFLRFIFHDVIGYRKKVVLANLRNSFPEKSEKELRKIARDFYLNLCDIVIESLKLPSINKKELMVRVKFNNFEQIERYKKENRNIIALVGHCNNWEMGAVGLACYLEGKYQLYGAYTPLHNQRFDRWFRKSRERTGTKMIPSKETMDFILQNQSPPYVLGLIADQSPRKDSTNNFIRTFLNQPTLFYTGGERLAMKTGDAVIYFGVHRKGRGKYAVDIIEISYQPLQTKAEEITLKYIELLEQQIREEPYTWLWSHRRWKHKVTLNPVIQNEVKNP